MDKLTPDYLEALLQVLDPSGPSSPEDRAFMAQSLRFFLKGQEDALEHLTLHPYVRGFAERMEQTLRANDWKGDLTSITESQAKEILLEEMAELQEALGKEDTAHTELELRDVATSCMIFWITTRQTEK